MQASSKDHRLARYLSITALFAAVALTAGCGDGGDDTPPGPPPGPLTVDVTVDEASGSVMTVQPGGAATIQVLSGKQLTFASPHGSTWTIVKHDGATASVQSDKPESKAVTISGTAGSTVDFQFVNSSNSAEYAVVTVRVAVDSFDRVAPRAGERQEWTHTSDTVSRTDGTVVSTLFSGGGYRVTPDVPIERYEDFDAADARTYTLISDVAHCVDAPAYPVVTYPIYTGATWTYDGIRTCDEGPKSYTHRSITSVITGFETVTTATGTYYAARLESTADVETTGEISDLNGSGTVTLVCWWATEIGRMVRCDGTETWEGFPTPFEYRDEMTSFSQ